MNTFDIYRYKRSKLNNLLYTNDDRCNDILRDYVRHVANMLEDIDILDLNSDLMIYLTSDPFVILYVTLSNSPELNEIENFIILKEYVLRRIGIIYIYEDVCDKLKDFINLDTRLTEIAMSNICYIVVNAAIDYRNLELAEDVENLEDLVLPLIPIIADSNIDHILGSESAYYINKITDTVSRERLMELENEDEYESDMEALNEYNMYDLLFFIISPEIGSSFNYLTCLTIQRFKGYKDVTYDEFFSEFIRVISSNYDFGQLNLEKFEDLKLVCLFIWFYSKFPASSIFSIFIELKAGIFTLKYFEDNLKNLIYTSLTTLRLIN